MKRESSKTRDGMRLSLVMLAIGLGAIGAIVACSDSTEPEPSPGPSDILTSMLSIAVIPDGSETFTVTATAENGLPVTCEVSCNDDAVATVMQDESSVVVTGVAYGKTTLTITTDTGAKKEIPVQVYDHHVLDTGDLLITYVDRFNPIARINIPPSDAVSFFDPIPPEGFHALGTLGFHGYAQTINGLRGMMVIKQKEGSNALAYPTDYILTWTADLWLHFFTPIPPEGYKAMGCVFTYKAGWLTLPPLEHVVCVREDLTTLGGVIDDRAEGADAISWIISTDIVNSTGYCDDYSRQGYADFWKILPPEYEYHDDELAYLDVGTFMGWCSADPPKYHEAMNILNVELPLLAEAPEQSFTPQLTGFDTPPTYTYPVLGKVLLVPCSIINDTKYAGDVAWRVANSPFYRLERQVFYKLVAFLNNTTSIVQPFEVEIRSGVTVEESEEFRTETGVSVRADVGVNIDWFSSRVSVTVSRTFGYETVHSISELNETAYWIPIHAPPHKAVACWQKYNRFVLKRHNGTSLETVDQWEFGIDSYVTDEYPD